MMKASIYGLLIIFMGGLPTAAAPPDELSGPEHVPKCKTHPENNGENAKPLRRPKMGQDSKARPRQQRRERRPKAGLDRPGPPEQRGRKRPAPERWRRLDRDGDRRVSYEEFAANKRLAKVPEERKRAIFSRIDKNGDGWIQPHEMIPPGHGPHKGGMGLRELDTNRDGAISYMEFARGHMVARFPEKKRRALFKKMDRNGDGVLSPLDHPKHGQHPPPPRQGRHPLPRPHPPLAGLDRNRSGGVDFKEFSSGKPQSELPEKHQRKLFGQIDRNGDGEIRRNEAPDRGKPKRAQAKKKKKVPEPKRPKKKKAKDHQTTSSSDS